VGLLYDKVFEALFGDVTSGKNGLDRGDAAK